MFLKLGNKTLDQLAPGVRVPRYRRADIRQHSVHLGVGGFHRAHQAVYLDDLLEFSDAERWGECGIGVLAGDAAMRDALQGQDCLYTVVERGAQTQTARVIGSLNSYVHAPTALEKAIETLADPETRIVSLTITEGGYFRDEGTGVFLASDDEIQHDVRYPDTPVTSLGLMAAGLDRRRLRGMKPFTVMSCDNLQGNGHITASVLLSLARLQDPQLAEWIAEHASFPNSMVDRITPATTDADRSRLAEAFGIDDAWPVVTEPFRQWVIEDNFSNGRPEWERVGVQVVSDVAPYETMKIRLLNGSHMAMAYLGALAGFKYVHEIMADSLFREFISEFMEEVTPIVPSIPGTSISAYKQSLSERFSNPTINDQVTRICSEGSAKLPKWLVPSMVELAAQGLPTRLLCVALAAWILCLEHDLDESGRPLVMIDARLLQLKQAMASSGDLPQMFLRGSDIFPEAFRSNDSLLSDISKAAKELRKLGTREALRAALRGI